jgi:hypothetical protein
MALQAGHLFGNYRIVRLLGEGGFGEVYLVENPLIERRAAVKVLRRALAQDAELVRRFLNEARAASAIRHRNIIEVFDGGVTPQGAPYILMEFLEGVPLQKRLTYTTKTTNLFATAATNGTGNVLEMYTPAGGAVSGTAPNSASILGTAAVGAMASGNQTFLNDAYQAVFDLLTRGTLAPVDAAGKSRYSYYNATVGMLTLLVMTGNFMR